MKTVTPINTGVIVSSLVFAGTMFPDISKDAYAVSAAELCERPNFKLWKEQQMNRMWEPTAETRSAESAGAVFTYNCFTSDEIDLFFKAQGDRVENAHFIPILENRNLASEDDDEDSSECD